MSLLTRCIYATSYIVGLSLVAIASVAFAAENDGSTKDAANIHSANPGATGIGTSKPVNKLDVSGDLSVSGDINFPGRDFQILGGGVMLWPGRLRFGAGGGAESGLGQWRGMVRAQPGGNMEIL